MEKAPCGLGLGVCLRGGRGFGLQPQLVFLPAEQLGRRPVLFHRGQEHGAGAGALPGYLRAEGPAGAVSAWSGQLCAAERLSGRVPAGGAGRRCVFVVLPEDHGPVRCRVAALCGAAAGAGGELFLPQLPDGRQHGRAVPAAVCGGAVSGPAGAAGKPATGLGRRTGAGRTVRRGVLDQIYPVRHLRRAGAGAVRSRDLPGRAEGRGAAYSGLFRRLYAGLPALAALFWSERCAGGSVAVLFLQQSVPLRLRRFAEPCRGAGRGDEQPCLHAAPELDLRGVCCGRACLVCVLAGKGARHLGAGAGSGLRRTHGRGHLWRHLQRLHLLRHALCAVCAAGLSGPAGPGANFAEADTPARRAAEPGC